MKVFVCGSVEGSFFEIMMDGEKLCVFRDESSPPSEYNCTVKSDEFNEMFNNAPEETKFLYSKLVGIFEIWNINQKIKNQLGIT